MSGDNNTLNPQITDVEIGVRSLRKITIYPLSMAAELKLTDLITRVLREFYGAGKQEDLAFISIIMGIIRDNLGSLIEMITDNENSEDLLNEITNIQAVELAEVIFDVNFAGAIKNAIGLFEKARNIGSPSKRSSQKSARGTGVIGLTTSTKENTPTEE